MAEEKKQLSLEEKVAQLDPEKYDMPRDKAQIREWRDRLTHLTVMKDFVTHPGAKELVEAGKQEVKRIQAKLDTDRDLLLNPNRLGERAALLAEKDTHAFYLSIFNVNPEAEIAMIEKAVDLELKPE